MLLARRRCGQPLGNASTVCALSEDSALSATVGLKRDPLSVGRPHRKTAPPLEGEALNRARSVERVDHDARFLPIIGADRRSGAVGRGAHVRVSRWRDCQAGDRAGTIAKCQSAECLVGSDRPRHVGERTRIGNGELKRPADAAPHPFHHGDRGSPQLAACEVERGREEDAAHRINQMTGTNESRVAASFEDRLALAGP